MKIPSQNIALPKSTRDLDFEDREQIKPLYLIAAQMRLQNQIEAFKAGLIEKDEVEVGLLKIAEPEGKAEKSDRFADLDAYKQHLRNAENLEANSTIGPDVVLETRETLEPIL